MNLLRLLSIVFATAFLTTPLIGCGDDSDPLERRPGTPQQPNEGVLPGPANPPEGDAGDEVTDATEIVLVAPQAPDGADVVPLRARLTNQASGDTTVVESAGPSNVDDAAVSITAGTYSLVYLDENGAATGFTDEITVQEDERTRIGAGAVWISPQSAVNDDREGTQSLRYEISTAEAGVFKVVSAELNRFVVVPPVELEWSALGTGGALAPLVIDAGTDTHELELGSVFVRKNVVQDVFLESASGVLLFDEMVDGVEYLLPATPQEEGCMVYFGVVNSLTTNTITLCSDAVAHVVLNAR